MSDRELLEQAAKAVGIEFEWKHCRFYTGHHDMYGVRELVDELTPFLSCGLFWNPLRDDGDALRLAAKLNLSVITNWGFDGEPSGSVGAMLGSHEDLRLTRTDSSNDVCAAWRRAIVLGAAEIGKSL